MDEKIKRIEEIADMLNRASEAYYNGKEEIMSNAEWDAGFDELNRLQAETGYIPENSPTESVGVDEDIASGQKEEHEFPALSLPKSKDVAVLQAWAGNRPIWLSWKLDGITLVATYDGGKLIKLMTRGNGTIGTNITFMAKYIRQLPMKLKYSGHLVVRGEALISYTDFERINDESDEQEFSNPRNLVAGTLALDKTRVDELAGRNVSFNAFTLVHIDDNIVSWGKRMDLLDSLGFTTVQHKPTDSAHLQQTIDEFTEAVKSGKIDYPVDGLVIAYDDTEYASTGTVTGHHATNAGMAFKWADTVAETTLDHIEWSCASSVISPVAVFDMVNLEGTEVRRASLCNISEMKRLGIGADRKTKLSIIKSNMIIPKCIKADACGTSFEIPDVCPVCGAKTEIHVSPNSGTETLVCTNEDCSAKQIKNFSRFVSRDAMNIDGISEKTIVKFVNNKFLSDFAGIYHLTDFEEDIKSMEGFGEKSWSHLMDEVEKSRHISPVNFIFALCIPLIGLDAAKKIIKTCGTSGFIERMEKGSGFEDVDGIGKEKSDSAIRWMEKNGSLFKALLDEITLDDLAPQTESEGSCKGLTFVITGDVHYFRNRAEFKQYVEDNGGKVAGSVSSKTDYLVNNDLTSTSGKNKKAKELGVPIISEDEFTEKF